MMLAVGWLGSGSTDGAPETLYPASDGTLADGGVYGPFDGLADDSDWTFDGSGPGYEGAITLTTEAPAFSLEHRVVWEYDLGDISIAPPVSAMLTFTIRPAAVYPFPVVDVHVYAYPADLRESPDDYHIGLAVLQGVATVYPDQGPTEYFLDVSTAVNEALVAGENKVAFRFQIDPDTTEERNQAFIDASDADPATKPFLTIDEAGVIPGDVDGDDDVDLDDFAGFFECFAAPESLVEPRCERSDFDHDRDVDLLDFADFQAAFTGRL